MSGKFASNVHCYIVSQKCDSLRPDSPTVEADDTINVKIMETGFHGKSSVFIAVELATWETLDGVVMVVHGDLFSAQRIQPQLLQMILIASIEQGIFLYTCVVQPFDQLHESIEL